VARLEDIVRAFIKAMERNKISLIGAIMTTVSFPVIIVGTLIDMLGVVHNPYFGFTIYMVLGPMFILGLVLVFIGVFFFKGKEEIGLFTFDYLKEHFTASGKYSRLRKLVFLVSFLTLLNIIAVSLVSYSGYHYTESVGFCGQFCHSVMHPEYVAYQNSPHSRVRCVECHIGAGAQWFAKSKISGARQLVAVAFDTYNRPIETPVHDLRPARETCEQCHRPELFHGDNLHVKDRFLPDEDNTHVQTVLLMKVGSGGYKGQEAHGIHWHVAPENKIIYEHADRARENITNVTLFKSDGTSLAFRNTYAETGHEGEAGKHGGTRLMDCIDCHNRPTHIYLSPEDALDQQMVTGKIPKQLPYIKREAMKVVTREYASQEEARQGIAARLREWYEENYPELLGSSPALLEQAIQGVQQAYAENVFPEMRIGWNTYRSFLGHRDDSGCFRCHDGSHETETGEVITMDCDACHVILAEDEPQPEILRKLRGT
jgi:hypothetical protein